MNRPVKWVLWAVFLLCLASLVSQKVQYWWEERTCGPPYEAVRTCRELETHIDLLRIVLNPDPKPEDCMQALVDNGSVDSIPLDPWSTPYEVRVGTNGDVQVWSCGPDGIADTIDDLSSESAVAVPHARKIPWGGGI